MTSDNVDEITELGMSFNIMIGKIKELLDSKIKEQENLKKAELRALQAQINPHFLYNTLDTIIWMAESKKTDQVVKIVSALSDFFRISLSKGMDWITIGEEMQLIRSYLTIQKMRYRDILDFKIEVNEEVAENTILKLTSGSSARRTSSAPAFGLTQIQSIARGTGKVPLVSMATSIPFGASRFTTSGTSATRRSPAAVSLGMLTLTGRERV
mgnify:CR=1 FL=1